MSDEVDYCGIYKQYKEELDFIRNAYNYDDEQFFEYQKNIVGACVGSDLDPKYFLDSEINGIKRREKLSEAERLKFEECEKARIAQVEKDRKKEEIERAKKMKRDGKPFICGTNIYEKLSKFVDNMKQNKRDWKAFAKKIARKPEVKDAARFVVDNPQISLMAAGLITIPAISTAGVAMFTAGAVSYYYDKVKEKNQEQSQQQNPQLTQKQGKNSITSDNTREAINTGNVNLNVANNKGDR